MAIAVPDAYAGQGLLFAFAYWAGRIMVGTLMVGGRPRGAAAWLTPYAVSIVITGPLLVAGALTSGVARVVIWAVAAMSDLVAPTVLQSRLRDVRYNAAHLAERFGAFVLIALGESVVEIGASAQPSTACAWPADSPWPPRSRLPPASGGCTSTSLPTQYDTRSPPRPKCRPPPHCSRWQSSLRYSTPASS